MIIQTKQLARNYIGYAPSNAPMQQNMYSSVRRGGTPWINEPFYFPNGYYTPSTKRIDPKTLMQLIKGTPECIGMLNAITSDIFTKFTFRAAQNYTKNKGRPKVAEDKLKEQLAQDFADANFLKQELKAAGFDWLGLGDAYLWTSKISDVEIKEMVKKEWEENSIYEFSELNFKASDYIDEESRATGKLLYVPATTMRVNYDEINVIGYQQQVYNKIRNYATDDIIHALFMKLDGKVTGFTPMEADYGVLQTLGFIKDYAGNWFNGGGVPDNVFIFEEEMAGSPSYELAKKNLEEFKLNRRRGNLLFTGKLTVEKINEWQKDLEFRKLAIYYTGIMAFSFNMPLGKIQAILGGDISGTAGGADTEDSGYWRAVDEAQGYWENLLNTQLFIPKFGVKIRFERKFPQDKIRRIQALAQAMEAANLMLDRELPVSDDYILDYLLEIPPEYRTEGSIKKGIMSNPNKLKGTDGEKSNAQKLDGENRKGMKSDKQKQAIGS